MDFRACLEEALGSSGRPLRPLPKDAVERLEALEDVLSHWSKAVALGGFKSPEERLRRYFAEALAAEPWLPDGGEGTHVRGLDIGSGGGSPGLPLAIVRSGMAWTLVEANERKALFLDEAVRALRLDNVKVVRGRYEDVKLEEGVEVVTSRGVALGETMLRRIEVDVVAGGRLLWFSSDARLRAARGGLESLGWRCRGPRKLVEGGGFLLVAVHVSRETPRVG